MNLRNCGLGAFFFFVTSLGGQAKEEVKANLNEIKHPVKPMLWKIEGNGLKNASYLFGTLHIADPRVTTLHPLAQQAFDASQAVYTEVDFSPAKQLAAVKFYLRDGDETLEQLVGKETVMALDAELKAINAALGVKPFKKMKVWMLAFMVPQIESQLGGKLPLDMQLWQRANKAGKKTAALETFEGQLGQLDKLTAEEQKELLVMTLKLLKISRERKVDPYQTIIDAYLLGDEVAIEKEMSKTSFMGLKMNPETNKKLLSLLLEGRNKGMANTIQETLKSLDAETHFFAAGAAHYIGDMSVNKLLQDAGYTVTRVLK
ncbi:MAG: TraB/GumN family protein [Akkermansiaceae bacterium]